MGFMKRFKATNKWLILVFLSHSILPRLTCCRFTPHSQLCLRIVGFVTDNSHIFLIDTTIYHSLSYSGWRYRLFNEISDVDDSGNSSFVHIIWQITSVRVTPSLTRHASVVRRRTRAPLLCAAWAAADTTLSSLTIHTSLLSGLVCCGSDLAGLGHSDCKRKKRNKTTWRDSSQRTLRCTKWRSLVSYCRQCMQFY